MNQRGHHAGAGRRQHREAHAGHRRRPTVTRRATSRAAASSPAPSAAPTSDCAAIATASRASAQKNQSCRRDLVGADRGDPEPGRHRGRRQPAGLERGAADQQVTAEHELPHDHRRAGPQRRPSRGPARPRKSPPETVCATTLATAEPVRPQPGRIDQQRAEHRGEHVRAEHEEQRAPGVLHAAHPAVAGRGEQQAGGAERRRCAASPRRRRRRPGRRPGRGRPARRRPGRAATSSTPVASASQDAWTPSATAAARSPAPKRRAARPVVPYAISVPNQTADRHHGAADRDRGQRDPARGGRPRRCRPARRAARRPGRPAPAGPGAAMPPGASGAWSGGRLGRRAHGVRHDARRAVRSATTH